MQTIMDLYERATDRWRAVPTIVVDAGIAFLCWLILIFQVALDGKLEWWVWLLAAGNALPLLWRRRFPFAVTGICGIGTTWLAIMALSGHIPAPQLVATYTFAALSPLPKRLIAVLATAGGITASIVIPDDDALNLLIVGITFAVAYAMGTSARARGDRIAMLEERARRLAEQQDAAATRERERIAREMHDILAHSISLVVIQAEAGPVAVRHDPERAEEAFDAISQTARAALTQLRRVLGVLRPGESDRRPQPGLDELAELVDGVRRNGLTVNLIEDGDRPPVPADLAATVYRLIQESLTNTVKHAQATTVQVRLTWRADALDVEVCDDGRGPAAADRNGTGSGHGLIGMRERVASVNGRLVVGPGPAGMGFCVAAHVPLEASA